MPGENFRSKTEFELTSTITFICHLFIMRLSLSSLCYFLDNYKKVLEKLLNLTNVSTLLLNVAHHN